ncbi:carboxymuconolactone decarboxylase family protein [Pseudomonas sp. SDO5532_S415]
MLLSITCVNCLELSFFEKVVLEIHQLSLNILIFKIGGQNHGSPEAANMSRIEIPSRENTPPETHETLDAIGKRLGFFPNLYRLTAISPKTLAALVALQTPLMKALDLKTRERIALIVSEVNGCSYCVAAHTFVGLNLAKDSPDEIALARKGQSSNPKTQAILQFAERVAEMRGHVSEDEITCVREAGFSDAEIIEVIGLVIQFSFTNYINNVFDTDIDFPTDTLV